MEVTCAAVVPAAGKGERVGSARNKLLLPLAGEPVLAHTLRALDACPQIATIILAAREQEHSEIRAVADAARIRKPVHIVAGGSTRQESVHRGLLAVPSEHSLVAVHDGARPLVTPESISACIAAAARCGAALLALPIQDTVKRVGADGTVQGTLDRSTLWAAQTPQVFRRDWLLAAYEQAANDGYQATDDCELVERLGHAVEVVPGTPENLKVTTPNDYRRAERIMRDRDEAAETRGDIRVGFGHDAHRLGPDLPLVLGGVTVPHTHGLIGHSDGDVLLHAITDALLGAAAAGDIGRLFPSSDPAYRGADSRIFLRRAGECVRERGMSIIAIDATLIAQAPKISPFVPQMQAVIAETLQIALERVSVKATTTDGLGYTGAGEGMAASAVATVREV